VAFALLALVAAEPALDCQADDVSLLQERTRSEEDKKSAGIPDLGALKDALGGVADQVSDFASKSIDQVTDQLSNVLEVADNKVIVLAAKCNDSLKAFQAETSMNSSLAQNITRLKALVNATVGELGPLFQSTKDQVVTGFEAAKSLLKPVGLDDEAEKLGACAAAAAEKLASLKEKAEVTLMDLEEATEEHLTPALDKMCNNLDSAKSIVDDFAKKFDSSFNDFASTFVQAVMNKLPAAEKETIGTKLQTASDSLKEKVHDLCEDLQQTVESVSAGAVSSAQSIDADLKAHGGFFGNIANFFKHLFR